MKKLDKAILALFSVIIFIQSVLAILVVFGWIKISVVFNFIEYVIEDTKMAKIILGFALVCLIGAIKALFFESSSKTKKTQGVLMQNDNGKLLISKATIENIVTSVVKKFSSVEDISVFIECDAFSNLIVNVNVVISSDVIIKELTVNMQNKIKEAIKKTSDLDVKEVNVKIKNILDEKKEKPE